MKLALCGFMGAGKTSVFNGLSKLKQFENFVFIDTDQVLLDENPSHSNISELVDLVGWKKFREDEENLIKKITRSGEDTILSLGGGSLNERVIEQLRSNNFKLAWLKVEFDELIRRATLSTNNRPLLKEKSKAEIFKLYQEREKLYSKADIIIENESIEETLQSIDKYLFSTF